MVLAIRFYDVGLRDDAVFWFYAAKDRYLTLDEVVDVAAAVSPRWRYRAQLLYARRPRSLVFVDESGVGVRSWVTVV